MNFCLKKNKLNSVAIFLFCSFLFQACEQLDLYEKNVTIPNIKWSQNFNATGSFNITDTTSTYNLYFVLRHTDAYKYNNIWLKVGLKMPGDSMQLQKINLPLGADATGWEGIGMNDIWEVRKLISTNGLTFKKRGTYDFSIHQIMRDNPLLHIMSVGMRLEKTP